MSRLRGNGKTNEVSNTEETANGDHARQLGSTTHMDKFYKKILYGLFNRRVCSSDNMAPIYFLRLFKVWNISLT